MGRFETEWQATDSNLAAPSEVSGVWIDRLHERRPPKLIILEMESSVSPPYGDQDGSAYNGHFGCRCSHPLFCFTQFCDLERRALRPGNVPTADPDARCWSRSSADSESGSRGAPTPASATGPRAETRPAASWPRWSGTQASRFPVLGSSSPISAGPPSGWWPSTISGARRSSGPRRETAPSSGRGCLAIASATTRYVFSYTRSPTTWATSCARSPCPRRRSIDR